ncbi:MAG: 3,4-dihydroxy-2-butanone-4-phosphate synthase [Gammaproteobacteria bacterium]
MSINNTEELIQDISEGKMVVLMDDEDRENEGDLILAAEKVSPEAINFMATHARGLICLALNEERCKKLGLEQMVKNNGTELGTAFTGSIEAATGVTTGISAADRSTTIQAAVKKNAVAEDIVQPGHVFPIKAQNGGVLTRAGHTEAGTDLASLAGFDSSAVIVEIMNEDGTMARKKDLISFAKKHSLKLGTIADLIHYRNTNERSVEKLGETKVETRFGKFDLFAYEDTIFNQTHLVLKRGEISKEEACLVRVQTLNTIQDVMGINEFGKRPSFDQSLSKISKEGTGVLLLLSKRESTEELKANFKFLQDKIYKDRASSEDNRTVGVGSQILKDLGIGKIKLIGSKTNYPLSGFDLEITEFIEGL